MAKQTRSFDADYMLIANCMMYGYVPTEFYRESAAETPELDYLDTPQSADSTLEAEDPGFDIAWLPMIFALILSILGITSVVANPRMTDSLAMHARNTIAKIGIPNFQWTE